MTSRQSYLYGIYREIARSRQLSQAGALPLGIEQIKSYVDYFRITRLDEREELFFFVGSLDAVYCEVVNKQMEEKSKPSK